MNTYNIFHNKIQKINEIKEELPKEEKEYQYYLIILK